ncbi:MAG: carbohydrate kinase family protein [SAR324 cluster bacterium]|nr:carbohydrate kinase family protein [SAR324 cluster bacterium]
MKSEKSTSKIIHCLGGALVDILIHPVRDYPRPKENTSVFVDSMSFSPGGGATNSAVTLAQMDCPVRLFSKIGDDHHGDYLTKKLQQAGVDVSALVRIEEQETSTVIVGVHDDGDRSFISYHGVLGTFSLEEVDRELLLTSSFLLYPDLFNLPGIDGESVYELLRESQSRGVTTIVDITWGISGLQKELMEAALRYVDYFLPSADELRLMYPQLNNEEIVEYLLAKGAKTVVLKLGSEGVLVANSQRSFHVPAVRTQDEVVDTTGAGDNFNAGFVYGLSLGKSLDEAVALGSEVAGVSIARIGAWTDKKELKNVLKQFGL